MKVPDYKISMNKKITLVVGMLLQTKIGYKTAVIFSMEYPTEIKMPCGEKMIINSSDDFPPTNVSCTCKNRRHYFIKWEYFGE